MSAILRAKISAVRSKHLAVAWGTGLAAVVGAGLALLAIGMLLDWWLNLSRLIRGAFLIADASALVCLAVRHTIFPIFHGPDDEEIALMVEEAQPGFCTRLIASIQLSRPGAISAGTSVALVRAMIEQTEDLAGRVDFKTVIKSDRLVRLTMTAVMAVLVFGGAFSWGRRSNVSGPLLARAFLSSVPVPRKTKIEVIGGNMLVARGDDVKLTARAGGVIPDGGAVRIRFASGRLQQFQLTPAKASAAVFECRLENVQDSFEYRLYLGDAESDDYSVKVLPRPVVVKIECRQEYPQYTHIVGAVPRAMGDLSILSGSRLQFAIISSNPCGDDLGPEKQNRIHLTGSEKNAKLRIDPRDPRKLSGEMEIPVGTSGFFVQLVDTDGLVSKDPAVYRIELVPDKPPTVRITWPERREELYTRVGKVRIEYEAADDFGLGSLTMKYTVDGGSEQSIPLELPGNEPKSWHGKYIWELGTVSPNSTTRPSLEGCSLEYWIQAVDNNSKTGPGKTDSEHFGVRVVTEAEKRAETLTLFGASLDRYREIKEQQEEINKNLNPTIEHK